MTTADKYAGSARVRLAFIAAGAVMVLIISMSYRSIGEYREAGAMERHAYEVLLAIGGAESAMTDALQAQRGYVITGSEDLWSDFAKADPEARTQIATIRRLTMENPQQQLALDSLEPICDGLLTRMRGIVQLRRTEGEEAALEVVRPGNLFTAIYEATAIAAAMRAEEERLIVEQRAAAGQADQVARAGLVLGGVATVLLVIGAIIALSREMRKRQTAFLLLEETLTGIPQGVFWKDLHGRYLGCNRAFATQMGLSSPEKALGLTDADLMCRLDSEAEARAAERRVIETGQPLLNVEETLRCTDGRQYHLLTNRAPLRGADGSIVGMLGVLADVTSLKKSELELASAMEAAQESNRSKTRFLANMSHEIRTPMTAILGFAHRLMNPGQPVEERRESVEAICRNGQHLLTIIDDILDLSKIEAGMMTVEAIECSPPRILADVISIMRPRAHERGIEIEVQCPGGVPETVVTDPTRLRQVLINLIGNAIKFTQTGIVRVVARTLDDIASDRRRLAMSVVDSGIGMTEEQIARLFVPFTQADDSTTRMYGGTGLGLSISKRLVQMLGGDIDVTSTPHAGSTFSFEIDAGPIRDVSMVYEIRAAVPDAAPASENAPRLRGRVLLAEDGRDNQRLISMFLRDAGAAVVTAGNGRDAIAAAMSEAFDLILMDIQMPVMDGYAATSELRERGVTIPIIALTAHAMRGDREKCLSSGCTDYLTKPIEERRLLETAARYLHTEPVTKEYPTMTQTTSGGTGIDTPLRSAVADSARMKTVLSEYVVDLPKSVHALTDAVAARNMEEVVNIAHNLSGTGGTFGFPSISALARDLEESVMTRSAPEQVGERAERLIAMLRRVEGYQEVRETVALGASPDEEG